jgi:stage III sporulation protein AD
MDIFVKCAAGVLVAAVLIIALSKQGKEISLLLVIAVCCMVLGAAVSLLQPVVDFVKRLQSIGQLDSDMVTILLKAAGIGLLAEITCLICADSGNTSLGKALQLLATAAILWLSLPLLNELVELIDNILGAI